MTKSFQIKQLGVYKILCSCGTSYIGQTGRSFEVRIKEHIADTNHNRIAKSTIAEHFLKFKHLIYFYQTQILARDLYYSTHLIREALEIENNPNNLNRDDGLKLSQSWAPIINRISNPSPNQWSFLFLIRLLTFLFLFLSFLTHYLFYL